MSGRKKRGDKGQLRPKGPRPAEAQNTELAKLLGNRTRALLAFEDSGFEPGAFLSSYLGQLSEKAIDNARQDLGALLATCTAEVESVVQQHHRRFLEACAGVEALEDQVALLRNYVNGLAALVASLKAALKASGGSGTTTSSSNKAAAGFGLRGAPPHHHGATLRQGALLPGESLAGLDEDGSGGQPGIMQQIEEDLEMLLQELDLASAGRDLPSAVAWLEVADSVASLLDRDASTLVMEVDDFPGWRHSYDAAVGLRKQKLVCALQRQLADANASTAEIGAAAGALTDLVGAGPALQAMLHCFSHKIRLSQALLLKQHTAGSDPNSLEFAGGLVQRTLLIIGTAGDALVATFGVAQRSLGSLFTVWAAREARGCATMLRQHVLTPATAASTGLHTVVQVVGVALVVCAMLEDSHSISLTSILNTELWPSIDTALRRHLKRFTEELRMSASEEVNSLVLSTLTAASSKAPGAASSSSSSSSSALAGLPIQVPRLVCCSMLADEVAMLAQLLAPIANPQLAAMFKKALLDIFQAATQSITFTLKSHMEGDAAAAGALLPLLPGVMEVLAGLIEEGLPSAVGPFAAAAGPVLDARALDRGLNTMYRECTAAARAAKAAGGGGGGGGAAGKGPSGVS